MTSTNIEVPEREPCAFCDYLSGRRPYTVLERTDTVAALVTREQRGVGHVLVVPTAHRETILDLTIDEASAIMIEVIRIARAIDQTYRRPGISIWQNNGLPAHQAIPHVHFHVAGTLEEGGTDWGHVPELTVEQTDEAAEQLRANLPALS
jgi:histidine triad (HIT) family protein